MAEIGLDISREFPKPLANDKVQAADAIITMGCGDACLVYPAGATSTGTCPTPQASTSPPSVPSGTRSASE